MKRLNSDHSRCWLSCLDHLVLLLPKLFKIIWFFNLSILSVLDEGYSRNALCALNLICTFLLKYKHKES